MKKTVAILMALLAMAAGAGADPINPGGGGGRAQDVTVEPSGNLSADDAQEGFVELQGDVDEINAAAPMTVNGQWHFSGLVFRDTYLTVAGTGATTTADGVYVWDTTQYEKGAFHKTTDGTTIETNAATAYSIRVTDAENWKILTTREWAGTGGDSSWILISGEYQEVDGKVFTCYSGGEGDVRVTVGRRHESNPVGAHIASAISVTNTEGNVQAAITALETGKVGTVSVGGTNYTPTIDGTVTLPEIAGPQGIPGTNGVDGAQGPAGTNGAQGPFWVSYPAATNSAGSPGEIAYDGTNFLYLCVQTNTWKRVILAAW
jgi:hypothetical protein